MANKKQVLKQLADYFAKKGKIMTPAEYKAADDAPMRFTIAKRPFGSWGRVGSMIKTNFPEQWEKANPSEEEPVAPKVAKAPKKKLRRLKRQMQRNKGNNYAKDF